VSANVAHKAGKLFNTLDIDRRLVVLAVDHNAHRVRTDGLLDQNIDLPIYFTFKPGQLCVVQNRRPRHELRVDVRYK